MSAHHRKSRLVLLGVFGCWGLLGQTETAADLENQIQVLNRAATTLSKSGRAAASEVAGVLRNRSVLLRQLAATDPRRARQLVFPPGESAGLRELSPGEVERFDTYTGPAEAVISDSADFTHAEVIYLFHDDGVAVRAYQAAEEAPEAHCADSMTLSGYRLGDVMIVTSAAMDPRRADETCSNIGPQQTAVVLVYLAGQPAPTITRQTLEEQFFGAGPDSVRAYFDEESYGQAQILGDVFGPFQLNRSSYGCEDIAQLRTDAIAAADSQVDFRKYRRIYLIHPTLGSCRWGGRGTIGCVNLTSPGDGAFRVSWAWQNSGNPVSAVALGTVYHEMGHNFGVGHARTVTFPGETAGPDRTRALYVEYGDRISRMGTGAGHFSASHRMSIGWLAERSGIRTVEMDGDYRVVPLQSNAGDRALRVRRKIGAGEWIWIEYRRPLGTFDSRLAADVFKGAILRMEGPETASYSELVDATPPTLEQRDLVDASMLDPALPPGRVWRDPYSDLTIEVKSADTGQILIGVRYETPCATPAPPSSPIGPEAQSVRVLVTGFAGCSWTASTNALWAQPVATSGTGAAAVVIQVEAHPGYRYRTASLTVARRTFSLRQDGPPSKPSLVSFTPSGNVAANTGWIPMEAVIRELNGRDDLKYIDIVWNDSQSLSTACAMRYDFAASRMSLMDTAGIQYLADAIRLGEWRAIGHTRCSVGFFTVGTPSDTETVFSFYALFQPSFDGRKQLTVQLADAGGPGTAQAVGQIQIARTCAVSFRPGRFDVPLNGGTYTTSLVMPAGCNWEASTGTSWITLRATSGTGNATLAFVVSAHGGTQSREGTIRVGEQIATVVQRGSQSGGPPTTISPKETVFSSLGGSSSIEVLPRTDVPGWIAVSDSPWLRVSQPRIETTAIVLPYTVEENTSLSPRTGRISIGSETFRLQQQGVDPARPLVRQTRGVVNAASGLEAIAANTWITVFGERLSETTRSWDGRDFNGPRLPTQVDGVQVNVNGQAAAIAYISPGQVNALVLQPLPVGSVAVQVVRGNTASGSRTVISRTTAPALFCFEPEGRRYAAATLADGTYAGKPRLFGDAVITRPALPGEAIVLYATGLGATSPAYPQGELIPRALPLARIPAVTIGGRPAAVAFAGLVSPGLYQINLFVPDLPAGDASVVVRTADGALSPEAFVTIAGPG